jgi:sterol 3beta-glucosyltransferase
MGSQIRERGEVKNFQTGVAEAGKGLWWGWWDGITGLVTEPIAGGKKEVRLSAEGDAWDADLGTW